MMFVSTSLRREVDHLETIHLFDTVLNVAIVYFNNNVWRVVESS